MSNHNKVIFEFKGIKMKCREWIIIFIVIFGVLPFGISALGYGYRAYSEGIKTVHEASK